MATCGRTFGHTHSSSRRRALLMLAVAPAALLLAAPAHAATDTWTGGSSNLWSNALNWSGGNPTTASVDSLIFTGSSVIPANDSNINDVAGLSLAGITFNAGADSYILGGSNGVSLTGNITDSATNAQVVNLPITLTVAQNINLAAGAKLTLGGPITGAFALNVANTTGTGGTLVLAGANTYNGGTNVTGGATLAVSPGGTLGSAASNLSLGGTNSSGNLDLSAASATVANFSLAANSTTASNITIGTGNTFNITGNLSLGGLTGTAVVTTLNVAGGGSLVVGSGTGGSFVVSNRINNNGPATTAATLNAANLSSFTVNLGPTGFVSIGAGPTGAGDNAPFGSLILGANNTITAGTLAVGLNNAGGNASNNSLLLGTTNVLNTDTITVGGGKTSGTNVIKFNTGLTNPSVTIRGSAGGSSRANLSLSDATIYTSSSGTNGVGVIDFTGGTVNAMIETLKIAVGKATSNTAPSNGTFTFSNGTVNVNSLALAQRGTSTAAAPANGILNVNGGSLIVNNSFIIADTTTGSGIGTANGALNVNGGTASTAVDILGGGGTSNITIAGGTLDMQTHNIGTASNPVTNLNLQSGNLINVGQINATNAKLSPAGTGTVGTLTIGSLTVNTANLTFDLGTGPGANDLINVTGSAAFNGAANITVGNALTTGIYTLLSATGGLTLSSAPTLNAPFTGFKYTLDTTSNPNAILLDVNPLPTLTWNGHADGTSWDTTHNNFSSGSGDQPFSSLSPVLFDDTAAPSTTSITLPANVDPSAVTVNSNTNNYTFSGPGAITGLTALTKNGSSILTINNLNTYTGDTSVLGGSLVIGSTGAIASGNITVAAGAALTLQAGGAVAPTTNLAANGNVTLNASTTLATLTGAGNLTEAGTLTLTNGGSFSGSLRDGTSPNALNLTGGNLTLSGNNTYSGGTTLSSAILSISTDNNLGNPAGAITFNNATLQITGTTYTTTVRPINLNSGVGYFNIAAAANNFALTNAISGGGGLGKSGPGTLTISGANTYSGTTAIDAGTLVLAPGGTLGSASNLTLGNGANAGTLDLTNASATVSGLSTLSNTTTPNLIRIGAGQSLTVNGNVLVGGINANGSSTMLSVSGPSVNFNGPNGNFIVGNQAGGNSPNTANAILDLSNVTNVAINYTGGLIAVGASPTGAQANAGFGTLILGANNTLTASTLRVGYTATGNTSAAILKLGTANHINADTLSIGSGKTQNTTGLMIFNAGLTNPTLVLRGSDGISPVSALKIGDGSEDPAASSSGTAGIVDFTASGADRSDGSVDILVNNLQVGIGKATTGNAPATGTLTFDHGTINATTITIAQQGTSTAANVTGTINVNGNASLIAGTGGIILGSVPSSPAGAINASLKINGGTVTTGADIIDGGVAAAANSTISMTAGILDLAGHNLGSSSAAIDNLTLNGGTLQNVAQINGGATGLIVAPTGTLTLAGNNSYSGGTTINAGTVIIASTGGLPAATAVTNNAAFLVNANTTASQISGNGALEVGNHATLKLAPGSLASNQTNVTIDPGAAIDLTTDKLIVESATKPTTLATLRGYAASHALTSSSMPANFAIAVIDNQVLATPFTTFGGVNVDTNAILVGPELLGDADANGTVDINDLNTVLNNFGASTGAWTSGNFDGHATIDLTDLADVLNNFGLTNPNPAGSLAAAAPEPTSLALLGLGAVALLRRRKA